MESGVPCTTTTGNVQKDGTLLFVQTILRGPVRRNCGRVACPSLGIIDSQSIKNSEWGIPDKGFDGNKKVNGRKRHLVVNTMGLFMCVVDTEVNIHDSVAAEQVIDRMVGRFPRLKKILADGGYAGGGFPLWW